MEQPRFWMWRSSKNSPSSSESIEEAFAEDAAGCFGAFAWPPRSYICSFCGREFRSAQALGGHMNSHRKDKASMLKQSPNEKLDHHQNPSETRSYYSFDPYSSSASVRVFNFLESKVEEEHTKKQNSELNEVDVVKSDLPMSLAVGSGNKELMACSKRRRTDEVSPPLFLKATMEDLDLELKLGD